MDSSLARATTVQIITFALFLNLKCILEEILKTKINSEEFMDKATKYVLVATFISFLYSVYLFFFMDSPDSKLYGIFVGIWVPSILSAFTVLKSSIKKEN